MNSNLIANIEEADYELLDSPAMVLANNGPQLAGFYSTVIDLLTAGNRGKAFTWALNGADLSTSPAALDRAYSENKAAVNAYLEYVDIDKIIQMITTESEQQKRFSVAWFRQQTPAFLAGAAIGAVTLAIFNNK